MLKPNDKVLVTQLDGKEFHGTVLLTETLTAGVKVRVQCGDFVLNVDEKLVSRDDWPLQDFLYSRLPPRNPKYLFVA
jgi:hypothetical protein